MLNYLNTQIAQLHGNIQNEVNALSNYETLEQEINFMVAGGKERIYLNQLASRLTGWIIEQVQGNIVTEEQIKVYPEGTRSRKQSLNASIYMVASYSVLMSGYTSADILHTALVNWADEDKVETETVQDWKAIAKDVIIRFQKDGILATEEDTGQMETGERFKAFPANQEVLDLRIETIQHMWENAAPKMKPMLNKVKWTVNGTCELPNLTLDIKVQQSFVNSLNRMGHTGYKVNPMIRAEIKRNLKRGKYPKDQIESMKAMLKLDPIKTYYFPHTPDYRGRVYARGGLTTFQGVKDIRAAFDFATSTIVAEDGLFLHIANACGFDKGSIEERINWVKNNHASLISDKRTTLYAERARLAYIEYKETGITNVICRIDGTCSGVQITSGLFLDQKTAQAVNVTKSLPSDKPADLYGIIADAAIKLSRKGINKELLKKYHRDLTKKVIMILAYGAGENTRIETLKTFLIENKERPSHAKSIESDIMNAIELEYPAITKLNNHLQLELDDTPMTRIVYKLSDITIVLKGINSEHLNLYGSSYTAKLKGEVLEDSDALARGIAPNFVHSLDSELLRKAVNKMEPHTQGQLVTQDILDISCIHDDLGVQSCDVKQALKTLRESYVEVIKADPLKDLYQAMGILEEYEPEDNGLDIDEVLQSSYLFS